MAISFKPKSPDEFWMLLKGEFLGNKVDLDYLKSWVRSRLEYFHNLGKIKNIPSIDVYENQDNPCNVIILADGKDLEIWFDENFIN